MDKLCTNNPEKVLFYITHLYVVHAVNDQEQYLVSGLTHPRCDIALLVAVVTGGFHTQSSYSWKNDMGIIIKVEVMLKITDRNE